MRGCPKGAGLADLVPQLVSLMVLGRVILSTSVGLFRKRLA